MSTTLAAAAAAADDNAPPTYAEYREVPLAQLRLSPLNPRKHFDPDRLAELAASMGGGVGVIEPLVVRLVTGRTPADAIAIYEIVAGARRFKAARLAGLATVPVSIRQLTDAQVLELMVIENDQRQDITPLEEADGFKRLISTFGVDIDKLAARIGRSRKYIYDRVKLLELIPAAQQLLERGRITAGHGILLARLTKEQQRRAIEVDDDYHGRSPLFEPDAQLLTGLDVQLEEKAAAKDPYVGMKAKSVRDLEAWIQDHCRFAPPADVQRELYPATAAALEVAKKVVHIHLGHYVQPDARDEDPQRIFGSQSWRRADGREKSKTCQKSKLGLVVVGEGQGQAFEVCVNRECPVHFEKEKREKARLAKMAPAAAATRQASADAKRQQEQLARDARRKAFDAAAPAILAAVAEKVRSVAIGKVATHVLADVWNLKAAQALLPRVGASADGALRLILMGTLAASCEAYQAEGFTKEVKELLGVDVAAILKKHAAAAVPVQTSAKAKRPAKAAKKR